MKINGAIAIILAILVLAVAVPLNLLAERLNVKWDMTPQNIYELNKKTKNILENLDKDVYVYTLFNLESLTDDTENPRQIMPLYELYKSFSKYEHVIVKDADPNTEEGLAVLTALNLPSSLYWVAGDTLVICGTTVKRIIGRAQYLVDDKTATIELNTENDLISAINYVAKEVTPVVYFLNGHGEKDIENYSTLMEQMTKTGYIMQPLNITENGGIPTDAEMLITASPTSDFTDDETTIIEEFLNNGGNIEMFLPPNSSDEIYKNISKIISSFGITMNFDSVTDPVNPATNNDTAFLASIVPYTPASSEYEGDAADLTTQVINLTKDDEGTVRIPTYFPASRSFYSGGGSANTKVGQLLVSYYNGLNYTSMGTPMGGKIQDTEASNGAFTLAAYSVDTNRKDAALVVFGADFIDNDVISSELYVDESTTLPLYINPTNLFSVTVTWIHETDIDLGIARKIITYDNMNFQTVEQANMMIVILSLIPAVFAVIGFVVYLRRGKTSA